MCNKIKIKREDIALCPRSFSAKIIDPQTMAVIDLAEGPTTETFSNATMALQVDNEVWIGTFSSTRIAYREAGQ